MNKTHSSSTRGEVSRRAKRRASGPSGHVGDASKTEKDASALVDGLSPDEGLRVETEAMWKALTQEEKHILTKYTQTYSYLNEPLRGLKYSGERPKAEYDKDMPLLTSTLNKFVVSRDMVVRRGTGDFYIP